MFPNIGELFRSIFPVESKLELRVEKLVSFSVQVKEQERFRTSTVDGTQF